LDIPIHYYARIEFEGFITMVDALGGVDVTVARGFEDPGYDGFGFDSRGFSITEGDHHLDGATALAYARSRKAAGESDFTRAARQQQILVAMRDQLAQGGSLLFELPALLGAVGQTVRSDVPVEQLPRLAAILDEVDREEMVSVVIRHPLVRPVSTRYGDSQAADLPAIRAMAAALFSPPGTPPTGWTPPT
jgi:anionic cell wall polymer biosynthesis LytR-Cps2A-Psr (LCP) family protein